MKAISATKATTAKVAGARGIRATCAGRRSVSARAVPLPDLPYDYGALEPYISGDIMKLHHQMHHGTYVKVSAQVLPLPAESVFSDSSSSCPKKRTSTGSWRSRPTWRTRETTRA